MKKVITIIMIALIAIIGVCGTVGATGESVGLNFTGGTGITTDDSTVTLTISLGDITGIDEITAIGFEAVLSYDEDIFSSAAVSGLNGWSASYDDSTQKIVADATTATANTSVAQIVLTLQDGVEVGETTVSLTSVLLNVNGDDDLTFSYEKSLTITISEPIEEEDTNTNTNTNSSSESSTTNNTTTNSNTDNTTTSASSLPKTGASTVAMIILLVVIIGVGCYVRYKSIEIK